MYQVLARKYRPKIFDEIAGQDVIVQTLKNAVIHGRIAHAYIFSGTRGVGKTSIARILAKSVNCVNGPTVNPCGVCSACIQIQNGNSVDVVEIDGASNTGVDSIRDLKENIIYLPQSLKYKIYIIDEVHMLSNSAFNALLKTLEEPPAHAKFIFATTELHKVPETILSRCQRFNFKRIPINIIYNELKKISSAENISVSDENLMIIASLGDGSIRDSLSTFDTVISYFGKDIGEDVSRFLGLTLKTTILNLTHAIFKKDYESAIKLGREIYDSGTDIRQFAKQFALSIRNILLVKFKYKDLINDMSSEEINDLIPLAEQKQPEELLDMMDILINSDAKYQKISSPSLLFELILFRLMNIPAKRSVMELLAKLEKFTDNVHTPNILATPDNVGQFHSNKAAQMSVSSGNTSMPKKTQTPQKAIHPPHSSSQNVAQMDIQANKHAVNTQNKGIPAESNKLFSHFDEVDEKLTGDNDVTKNNAKINENTIINGIKNIFGKDIKSIDDTQK